MRFFRLNLTNKYVSFYKALSVAYTELCLPVTPVAVICCRCEEARTELQRQPLSGSCECMKVDLGDFASVRAFAKSALQQLQAQHKKIQILVNNAG